jgi:glycosyltransferase involved in cell wall biosynthesis
VKVVFLTSNYPPTICGVGDHTYHLAHEMSKHGVDVSVICSDNQNVVQSDEITIFPIVSNCSALGTEGVDSIFQLVKKIQPDWFIVQYVPHAYHPKGLPLKLVSLYQYISKLNISILTIFHEVKIRPERAFKTQIMSFLQGKIAYKLANLSEKIATSIDFYDNNLKNVPLSKKAIIPIASNILPFKVTDLVKENLKNQYQIKKGTKVICTFGNRDISSFLPVFDLLVKDYPNLKWLLCGKNSTPSVILTSRSYIQYAGEMAAEQIYQHLSLADVFFMPDLVSPEGEGGTCNKSGSLACALSLGIPVVGAKGDMNNQLLIDGENILLTEIRDSQAIYKSLKSCLDSAELSAKLGKNAQQFHEKSLTWAVSAEQFFKLMQVNIPNPCHRSKAVERIEI